MTHLKVFEFAGPDTKDWAVLRGLFLDFGTSSTVGGGIFRSDPSLQKGIDQYAAIGDFIKLGVRVVLLDVLF